MKTLWQLLQRVELSGRGDPAGQDGPPVAPDDGEVAGLLALMLLTDARRPARTGLAGELIPLADRDRTLWDQRLIVDGTALISVAVANGSVGEYQLQAVIAALHDLAARPTGRRSLPSTDCLSS